ncbi:helix-turn-helix domain-containing protein [Cellulosimicrobium cellulans]|uniref:helix-turn-helix domain-containing protein n=1 Tax=Cellulosimicrobium cellulans TaxID=1710 RepID=UPI002ADDF979|nr:helix-turn-helix transcriptional regulator [Cellulosimicrobium cellulans]
MINGREIRAARERAGMTQGDLAQRVGVSLRTVGNWERGDTVPMNRASAVESALAQWLDRDAPGPRLATASDGELLAEIARRFERGAGDQARVDLAHSGPGERENVVELRRRADERQGETGTTVPGHERAVANEDDTLEQISEEQQEEP